MNITVTINGKEMALEVRPSMLLIDLLRDELELKGTKPGCLEGECGACTVLIDGAAVNSCLFLAINTNGKSVTTIEGLGTSEEPLDIVQEKLIEHGGVQCGFCTSGMAISIKAYTDKCKDEGIVPTRAQVKKSLEGNLCRCTGYVKIIDAAEAVFKEQDGEGV